MFESKDKESIEYFRESLKLIDRQNARAEIFAYKNGIALG